MGPEPKKDERKVGRDARERSDAPTKDLPTALHDNDIASERGAENDNAVDSIDHARESEAPPSTPGNSSRGSHHGP